MAKKGKKSTTTMHTWAISRIKGTPAVEVGWVDAPYAETAINEAIERYGTVGDRARITEPQARPALQGADRPDASQGFRLAFHTC